jgi:osmotically-inducible protein OsmY
MQGKTLLARNILIGLLALGLSGCAAVVVGGAATGASVAHDRRTAETVLEDNTIYLKANDLRNNDADLRQKASIDIDVFNHQVLLTGQAQNREVIERFRQRVAAIDGVRAVFDEVTLGAEPTLSDATSDSYLTSRVKIALFNVKIDGFDPTRVMVVSSLGSVYLMGLLTPTEANAVVEEVRFVSGVKRVVKLFEYLNE